MYFIGYPKKNGMDAGSNVMLILCTFILLIGLTALFFYDIKYYRLPNFLTYPLIVIGILQSLMLHRVVYNSVAGAIMGYAAFFCIELAYKQIYGKDGLGRGDAKLLAVGGAWCGVISLPAIVAGSSIAGIIFALFSKKNIIPFGPFLAVAIFSCWTFLNIDQMVAIISSFLETSN